MKGVIDEILSPYRAFNRAVICGSTEWKEGKPIREAIINLAIKNPDVHIINGGARGADMIADTIARSLGLIVTRKDANWTGRGKIAGRERNEKMLSLNPDLVLAFKDDFDSTLSRGGTEHMCRIALEADIPVLHYSSHSGWRSASLERSSHAS